ncbi:MAG: hypothetical protein ABWJ97_03990 [Thermoproteus sp.]
MTCVEREYIAIIRERLGCRTAEEIDIGFASVRPDLICGGVPTEVECINKAHYGVGQALAYKYAAGAAKLVVVADAVRKEALEFLKWASRTTGVEVILFVGDEFIRV